MPLWKQIQPCVPKPTSDGRPTSVDRCGILNSILDLVRKEVRTAADREGSLSAALLAAQSAKTVEEPATCRGIYSGKQVKWRKRHLDVDMLGLPLVVLVVTAEMVVSRQNEPATCRSSPPDGDVQRTSVDVRGDLSRAQYRTAAMIA